MDLCYDCRKEVRKGRFRCDECLRKIYPMAHKNSRRKTEWEELKLKFYKSDKMWQDNIRSREVRVDKNGKKEVVYRTESGRIERLPQQPKQLWNN